MRHHLERLLHDRRGASLIEFAIALPVLILIVYGIFTVGMLFQANAGMQHALGEAARHATIFPTPSDDQIKARVSTKKFGTNNGTLSELGIQNVSSGGTTTAKVLTLTYSQPTNFLFFPGPTVTITKTKRVYIAPPAA